LENAMPDTSLLWILGLFFFLFYIAIQFVPIANARGELALSGVLDGIPLSLATRRMILFTHYIPLASFFAVLTLIACFGFIEMAKGASDPRVAAIGYMVAVISGSNTLVWTILQAVWVPHIFKAIR
jgi:hypothetical protein